MGIATMAASYDLGPVLGTVTDAMLWAMGLAGVWVVFDWLTGTLKAAKSGALSSKVAREGMWHKAGEVLVVALAFMVEVGSAHLDMGFTAPVLVPACLYVVLTETMSILENICCLAPELRGTKLMQLFESTKADAGGAAGKGEGDGQD